MTADEAPLRPEVLEPVAVGPEVLDPEVPAEAAAEAITQPTKLIRIASMVRSLLDEARRAPLDDAGRRLLREIHDRSLRELREVLSEELRTELGEMTLPFTSDTPSESELRVAQAQLVGWLEGLFHGIQATLFTQQMAAQRQFEQMRGGRMLPGGDADMGNDPNQRAPGAYL
jgi:hypothetical protein